MDRNNEYASVQTFMNASATAIRTATNYLGRAPAEFRHRHAPVAGRHRRGAAARRTVRRSARSCRWSGIVVWQAQGRRPHRRRRPGANGPDHRRHRLAPGRRGRHDPQARRTRSLRLEVLPADSGPDSKHELLSLVRKKVSIEGRRRKSVIELPDGSATRRIGVISLPPSIRTSTRSAAVRHAQRAPRGVAKLLTELRPTGSTACWWTCATTAAARSRGHRGLTGLFIDQGPGGAGAQRQGQGRGRARHAARHGLGRPARRAGEPRLGLRLGDLCRCHRDYGRGLIISEPTFGRGTVQNLVDLDAVTQQEKPIFGELKMTIAQFFRANGGAPSCAA